MDLLERASSNLNRGLAFVAGVTLVVMMGLTVTDMFLRVFSSPLTGTYEAIGWLAATTCALSLGYTQLYQGHVSIGLVVAKLGNRARAVVECAMDILSALLFAIVAWRVFRYAGVLRETGSLSETLRLPVYPWVYLTALGCGALFVALLADCLKNLRRLSRNRPGEQDTAVKR